MPRAPAPKGNGGGGGGEGLERILFLARRLASLTRHRYTEYEVKRILELRMQGLGYTEIAKAVYGYRGARSKVYRIVKRAEALAAEASSCRAGEDAHVSPMHREPEDGPQRAKADPPYQPGLLAPMGRIPRLGPTQKLVLEALMASGWATPSGVAAYAWSTYGVRLSRNAAWQALRRLERRGLVVRGRGGRYSLAWRARVYVENLRVDGLQLWSTREQGRPATLDEALTLARLAGRTEPVEQAELFSIASTTLRRRAEELRRLGWRMTVIYLNEGQGLKIEHRIWATPLPARPEKLAEWLDLHRQATQLALETAAHALNQHPLTQPT